MSIRPFWVETVIDGRKNNLSGGPKAKDGCMRTSIYARDNGEVKKVYTISCYPGEGKDLKVDIIDSNGEVVHSTKSVY